MTITKRKTSKIRNWSEDIRRLDNLANAYHNAECGTTKAVWKQKWYDMCKLIASRMDHGTRH